MTKTEQLEAACRALWLFRAFSDEVLPQAGKLVISVGTINDALILSGKVLHEVDPKRKLQP